MLGDVFSGIIQPFVRQGKLTKIFICLWKPVFIKLFSWNGFKLLFQVPIFRNYTDVLFGQQKFESTVLFERSEMWYWSLVLD